MEVWVESKERRVLGMIVISFMDLMPCSCTACSICLARNFGCFHEMRSCSSSDCWIVNRLIFSGGADVDAGVCTCILDGGCDCDCDRCLVLVLVIVGCNWDDVSVCIVSSDEDEYNCFLLQVLVLPMFLFLFLFELILVLLPALP